jgi:hypothetical protein
MRDSEKNLARFYQDHPYLIASEFGDRSSVAEQVIGKNRLDLLVRLASGTHSIVEFKREPLRVEDVNQLVRYWKAWKKTHRLAAKHYLVGLRPRDPEGLQEKVKSAPMHVIIRTIPDDVPSVVLWSEKTRRYIPYREGDKGTPIELFIAR